VRTCDITRSLRGRLLYLSELQHVPVCYSVLRCVAACCNVPGHPTKQTCPSVGLLQCVAVCCSVLQCVAVCSSFLTDVLPLLKGPTSKTSYPSLQRTTTHRNTHCNTLQLRRMRGPTSKTSGEVASPHVGPNCNTLPQTATHGITLQHTATHTATQCKTLQ